MRIFALTTIWLAAASVVAESKIKNVLFLISDDLKASVLGVYGDPICETPNIDRLAQEGMVFDRTYCQGTSCAPSRRSFMHSRYEGETEINMGKHSTEQRSELSPDTSTHPGLKMVMETTSIQVSVGYNRRRHLQTIGQTTQRIVCHVTGSVKGMGGPLAKTNVGHQISAGRDREAPVAPGT